MMIGSRAVGGMSLTFMWLCLCAFLVGCPAEVMSPPDSGTDASEDVIVDAGKDIQMREAGEGGYDFNLQGPSGGAIKYGNGLVMTQPAHIYLLWYGNWNNNTTIPIVENFIIGLNGSPYFSITAKYYELYPITVDATTAAGIQGKLFATDKLILTKSVFIDPYLGTVLTDDNIFDIVRGAIDSNQVPSDLGAIYLVLTSSDIIQGGLGGFCQYYCGWHDHKVHGDVDIKFSFVGDPGRCIDGCTAKRRYEEYGFTHSPNFNWSADGMVSVIAHELTETITDPCWDTAPGWMDDHWYENADKCAWRYGEVYQTANGSIANIKLGNDDYLVQQNWALFEDGGEGCSMRP